LAQDIQDYFIALVIEPNFDLVKCLEEVIGNQREEFARAFVNVLVAQKCETEGLKSLLENEVNSAQTAKILFRGNSITTKAIDYYMKLVGGQYLYTTLHSLMDKAYKLNTAFEVDPNKLTAKKVEEKEKHIKKNLKGLLGHVEEVLNAILNTKDTFPPYPRISNFNLVSYLSSSMVSRA
jgi:hypothetical protein